MSPYTATCVHLRIAHCEVACSLSRVTIFWGGSNARVADGDACIQKMGAQHGLMVRLGTQVHNYGAWHRPIQAVACQPRPRVSVALCNCGDNAQAPRPPPRGHARAARKRPLPYPPRLSCGSFKRLLRYTPAQGTSLAIALISSPASKTSACRKVALPETRSAPAC